MEQRTRQHISAMTPVGAVGEVNNALGSSNCSESHLIFLTHLPFLKMVYFVWMISKSHHTGASFNWSLIFSFTSLASSKLES